MPSLNSNEIFLQTYIYYGRNLPYLTVSLLICVPISFLLSESIDPLIRFTGRWDTIDRVLPLSDACCRSESESQFPINRDGRRQLRPYRPCHQQFRPNKKKLLTPGNRRPRVTSPLWLPQGRRYRNDDGAATCSRTGGQRSCSTGYNDYVPISGRDKINSRKAAKATCC